MADREHAGQFQVGDLRDPHDDDPWFGTKDEARTEAEKHDAQPWAVWDEDANIIFVLYEGETFVPW